MIYYPDVTNGNQIAMGPVSVKQNGDVVISISASVHLGAGGHVSVGFNLTEYWRRLWD